MKSSLWLLRFSTARLQMLILWDWSYEYVSSVQLESRKKLTEPHDPFSNKLWPLDIWLHMFGWTHQNFFQPQPYCPPSRLDATFAWLCLERSLAIYSEYWWSCEPSTFANAWCRILCWALSKNPENHRRWPTAGGSAALFGLCLPAPRSRIVHFPGDRPQGQPVPYDRLQ